MAVSTITIISKLLRPSMLILLGTLIIFVSVNATPVPGSFDGEQVLSDTKREVSSFFERIKNTFSNDGSGGEKMNVTDYIILAAVAIALLIFLPCICCCIFCTCMKELCCPCC